MGSARRRRTDAGTVSGLHHLTGRLRGRRRLARVVGTRGPRVSRLARRAARTRLHDLDGSEHVPSDVGFATESEASESDETTDERTPVAELARLPKVVFSSTLEAPLSWANTRLVSGDAVEAVRAMKRDGNSPMRTLGSLTLCRSLLKAGLVDRFRVVVFPVITGKHRPRPDLRRLSRCRPRHGCQPDVRRQNPAARVCPHGARRSARRPTRLLTTGPGGGLSPATAG